MQRIATSPSKRCSGSPQTGQFSGGLNEREPFACSRTSTTFGMMSPPFSTMIVSPMRTSFRASSSKLCSDALTTFVPPRRAGGGIARIGERLLACFFELSVVSREIGFGDVDLSAHFQPWKFRRDFQRQRAHGADVRRDVVAAHAVAARGAARQLAVFVEQIDRYAVDLQL